MSTPDSPDSPRDSDFFIECVEAKKNGSLFMSAKRKVLVVSVGNGGNRITTAFFQQILKDNGVNSVGAYSGPNATGLDVFCDRLPSGALHPRRILVDMNPDNIEKARQSEYGILYNQSVAGSGPIQPIWAYGYCGDGSALAEQTLQEVQMKVDQSGGDCVIWVIHTLGGGCGSGVGSLLLDMLATQIPNVPRISIAVLPSTKVSDGVTQPYNAGLALDHILSSAHQVVLLDNEKLYDICFKGGISTPTYDDLNGVASRALATLVSPVIWPGADGQRMSIEAFHASLLIPSTNHTVPWYERTSQQIAASQKIVSVAAWPHVLRAQSARVLSSTELAKAAWSEPASLLTPAEGQWLRNLSVMNGVADPVGSFSAMSPISTTTVANSAGSVTPRRTATAGIHTGVVRSVFAVLDKFSTMFRRKAFLHWYTEQGIDEMAFMDAESRLGNLATTFGQEPEEVVEEPDYSEE